MVVAAVLIAEISREFTFYNNSKIALNSHSVVKMWFRKSYSVSTLDLSNKSSPEFYFGSQGLKHYKSLKKNLNCLNFGNNKKRRKFDEFFWFISGLLDSFGTSEDIESCWTEDHLDCPSSNESFERKVSPPYITVLSDSKCRSGSDPTISRQPAIDQKKGSRSQENSITSPKSSKGNQHFRIYLKRIKRSKMSTNEKRFNLCSVRFPSLLDFPFFNELRSLFNYAL